MLGSKGQGRLELDLQKARMIPLHASRSPALAFLKHVLPLIDLGGHNEASLRMLGIDDMLYRIVAVMLAPQTLVPALATGHTNSSAARMDATSATGNGPRTALVCRSGRHRHLDRPLVRLHHVRYLRCRLRHSVR